MCQAVYVLVCQARQKKWHCFCTISKKITFKAYIQTFCIICRWNVLAGMCRIGWGSFWCWRDVSWSTFNEDMCKICIRLSSQWPCDFSFTLTIHLHDDNYPQNINCPLCSNIEWTKGMWGMWKADRQAESQKQSISTGEMYLTICVEWATDHFGLCLT